MVKVRISTQAKSLLECLFYSKSPNTVLKDKPGFKIFHPLCGKSPLLVKLLFGVGVVTVNWF